MERVRAPLGRSRRSALFCVAASCLAFGSLPTGVRADAQIPIPGPVAGSSILVNPVTHRIYVFSNGLIREVDAGSHAVRSLAGLPTFVFAGAVDPIHNRIYALARNSGAGQTESLLVIDGPTLALQHSIPVGTGSSDLQLDAGRDLVWVSNRTAGTVKRIVGSSGSTTTLGPGLGSGTLNTSAIDPVGGFYYAVLQHVDVYGEIGEPLEIVEIDQDTLDLQMLEVDVSPDFFGAYAGGMNARTGRLYLSAEDIHPQAGIVQRYAASVDVETATVAGATSYYPSFPSSFGVTCCDIVRDRVFIGIGEDTISTSAHEGDQFAVIAGSGVASSGGLALSPATNRIHALNNDDWIDPPDEIYEKDLDALTPATEHSVPPDLNLFGGLGVDVAANRIYALGGLGPSPPQLVLFEIDESESTPIPIVTTIWNDTPMPGGGVTFHFSAMNGFAPYALPIRQIYYQVDSTDGSWTPAAASGPNASATVSLSPGAHTIYAFAVDGQESTMTSFRSAVLVGQIASLEVTVPSPPACANGLDDDGDLATDFPADTLCRSAADNDEASNPGGCGLGAELTLLVGALARRAGSQRRVGRCRSVSSR